MPDRAASSFSVGRHAGILVPLFSIPSRRAWGIGEIPDLVHLGHWMEAAGLDFVQLLPVNEMQEGEHSPYSALSAMAIDPVFIALDDVPDFVEPGAESVLTVDQRSRLAAARAAAAVDYPIVRDVKGRALRAGFARFLGHEWAAGSPRAVEFRTFRARERWWLADYSLFRALHDENGGRHWQDWEPSVRDRDPVALSHARGRLSEEILYFDYIQWLAQQQWQRVRRLLAPVGIFGDFPFMVSGNSADVWARQDEFRLDATVGVPPDAFSETGQDWGLPVYRWDAIAAGGYQWLRQRTRRCVELYDGFRIDHLVGFYRTFVRERDGTRSFVPDAEPTQRSQGERLLDLFRAHGSFVIAEDLGTVPDFVRESMEGLGVPGMKVLRWEREWEQPGRPFRDPAGYPAISVATSGTHDTEPMAEWWDSADLAERQLVLELPALARSGCRAEEPYSARIRDALLEVLFNARSTLVLLAVQDVFGWRDRINIPASIGEQNWTWRLPWPVEDLLVNGEAVERARFLRALAERCAKAVP
ncbi:MAG TPA: 4-alpha-glucanotransferase [Vicinamibacterales bacterium]|nr:4-alpha-glucanotransferase [Vicinamibacterales bacterium]